jgi:NAD(P)-dependent dehydrogenase (short-subunit alcohol dehydrogenase family)
MYYWQDDCYYYYFATAFTDTVLITGSTDGIGVTTARNILGSTHNILIHGRDEDRIRIAADSLRNNNNNNIRRSMKGGAASKTTTEKKNLVVPLPPADLSTIRGCYDLAREVKELCNSSSTGTGTGTGDSDMNLKILVNNAGIYSNRLIRTTDGLESTFAVNALAPFILSSMLLSALLANGSYDKNNNNNRSRIVIASSVSQSWKLPKDYWDDPQYEERSYSAHGAYSETKLLDAMLTIEMAHRLDKLTSIVTCNCLDPGTVNTKMLIDGWGPIGIDVNDALDETWCCQSSELEGISGQYFVSRTSRKASSDAYDTVQRDKLWQILSELAPESAAEWDRAVSMYSSK